MAKVSSRDLRKSKKQSATKKKTVEQELNELRPVVDEKTLNKLTKAKPKTARARKALAEKEPQVHESTKNMLLMKGTKCSDKGQAILKDLALMRKPYVVVLGRRRQTKLTAPFSDPSDFQFLGDKNNCPLFGMISTTKKHPLRLFCGRLFNWKLYDLYEFDIVDYEPLNKQFAKLPVEGSKPVVVFQGSMWELSPTLLGAKNCLCDILGGIKAERIFLENFDRAFTCAAYEKKNEATGLTETLITITHWQVNMKKDPENPNIPTVDLEFIGPRISLRIGKQSILPDKDVVKAAMKIPSEEFVKGKSSKKTETNDLKETRQQVHVVPEDLSKVYLRHGRT